MNVKLNPVDAAGQYSEFEKSKPIAEGYEVLLIGAKRVDTIKTAHSHYFGVKSSDVYLSYIGIAIFSKEKNAKGNLPQIH